MHGLEAGVKTGGTRGGNLRERINKWISSGKKPGPGAKLRKKENAWIRRSKMGRGRGRGDQPNEKRKNGLVQVNSGRGPT